MSVAGRLGAFSLVLAGSFGAAYALGENLPGHDHGSATADAGHDEPHDMTDDMTPGMSAGPVLPSDRSGEYRLLTETALASPATFRLLAGDGTVVTEFAEDHGALLHVIVARPDLSEFHHLHPDIAADGTWVVELPDAGRWHVVFESSPVGSDQPVIVAVDLGDEADSASEPPPPADDVVEVDGLVVTRDGFGFTVTAADGSAATGLEPYLGQAAHLVALRDGDLAFEHLHPQDSMPGMLMFGTGVTEPGTYRLFLQFGHDGDVLTVPFTVVVP